MHPTSRNCREFLQAVLTLCHRMVLTTPIQDEWSKHESRFARTWRKSMMARKKIELATVTSEYSLEETIASVVADESVTEILEKDRHLLEAALITDKRVASLDDEVRISLRENAHRLLGVPSICWVNPNTPEEQCIAWLTSGAPDEKFRRLGYFQPRSKE